MSNLGPSPWDEATDAKLRSLWDAGHSTPEIARAMAMTKNQIIGRAHRLRLSPRPSPSGRGPPAAPPAAPAETMAPVGRTRGMSSRLRVAANTRHQSAPAAAPSASPAEIARANAELDAIGTGLRLAEPLRIDAPFASQMPAHQEPRGCLFPIGSGAAWRFCQRSRVAGLPYCPAHCAIAYRRVEEPAR